MEFKGVAHKKGIYLVRALVEIADIQTCHVNFADGRMICYDIQNTPENEDF